MKPMSLDACRGLVALLGSPDHSPQGTTVRRFEDYDNPTHPLQAWVDELPSWQLEEVPRHFKHERVIDKNNRASWDEAWARAIYDALWY